MVWRTTVPFGQSSPVVVGRRVYLTARDGDRLLTLCLDVETGRETWRREIRRERSQQAYRANDPASPTPAADEHGVVVFFADFGLAAYSPDGEPRWTLPLGPFENFYGMAASPILAGDLLVLVCDQNRASFLLGVDRKTGRVRWKTERAADSVGWATPMVFRHAVDTPAQIIVLGSNRLASYSLETGEPRWFMPLASMGALGTAVSSGDTLFVSTVASNEPWVPAFEPMLKTYDKDADGRLSLVEFRGDPDLGEHFGWIDTNGDQIATREEWEAARAMGIGQFGAVALRPASFSGKVDPESVLWRFKKNVPYVPAPLVYRGVFYMVKSGGVVTSLDPATGRVFKEGRTREALGDYQASPVAADDKVFLASVEGKMTVLKAGEQWEILGVNDLGDEIHATPALSGGRIYVRTAKAIYCFGAN
jgi:outer membrane protein assembly factor BamB